MTMKRMFLEDEWSIFTLRTDFVRVKNQFRSGLDMKRHARENQTILDKVAKRLQFECIPPAGKYTWVSHPYRHAMGPVDAAFFKKTVYQKELEKPYHWRKFYILAEIRGVNEISATFPERNLEFRMRRREWYRE